jgi:capsular polysaccharide biosynthesis protein
VDASRPLVNPDGNPPSGDEPAGPHQDGQRPALAAVPSGPAVEPEAAHDPGGSEDEQRHGPPGEPGESEAVVSATFRAIERRAYAEIHRLAAESRREIEALQREFPPPAPPQDDPGTGTGPPPGVRRRFRLGRDPGEEEKSGLAGTGRPQRTPRVLTLVLVALAIVLLSVGSAYVYGVRLQPELYGAEATFNLTPRFELSDTAVDRETETQLIVVTSSQVLQPVAALSGVPLSTLEREVSSDMAGRSNVLVITVADPDRRRATTLADLVARQYARVSPALTGTSAATRPVEVTPLTAATAIDEPLQPRPLRTVAAGLLVGTLAALLVVVLLRRPWRAGRQQPYWR